MWFLRDNINNFSNKELCEELESRFNIKSTPEILASTLSQKGIKRDFIEGAKGVSKEIAAFVIESKINDVYHLRDKIIEEFGEDVPTAKLKNLMSQRKENLPGEGPKDELNRIKNQRQSESIDETDIDDLDLDD